MAKLSKSSKVVPPRPSGEAPKSFTRSTIYRARVETFNSNIVCPPVNVTPKDMVVKIRDSTIKVPQCVTGNGKELDYVANSAEINVIGNGNTISVGTNDGILRIIGDRCVVKVLNGKGSVFYTGNHGRIGIGKEMSKGNVVQVGNCTKIMDYDQVGNVEKNVKYVVKSHRAVKPCKVIKCGGFNTISFY